MSHVPERSYRTYSFPKSMSHYHFDDPGRPTGELSVTTSSMLPSRRGVTTVGGIGWGTVDPATGNANFMDNNNHGVNKNGQFTYGGTAGEVCVATVIRNISSHTHCHPAIPLVPCCHGIPPAPKKCPASSKSLPFLFVYVPSPFSSLPCLFSSFPAVLFPRPALATPSCSSPRCRFGLTVKAALVS